ncbi:MAG: hypothetical protein V1663_02395 [archaeon]
MDKKKLKFQGDNKMTILGIFILILKIFLWGSILLIIIAILTFNSALVYPVSERINEMLIQIFVLGILFMIISKFVRRKFPKDK